MNIIKKIIHRMYDMIHKICLIIKIVLQSLFYKNKMYLFGIPVHGNLGDQAILLAEKEYLKDQFQNTKLIEVESTLVVKFSKILKKLVGDSVILMHGGGFLGTLWINEEEMFRKTLQTFSKNDIIVLPQTIYFSNDEEGQKVLEKSQEIYSNHKNLYICCREDYSYNFMKEKFPLVNILLVPDMVLYLEGIINNIDRDGVLFCIRSDKEKVKYNFEQIEKCISEKKISKVDYTDTVISKSIYSTKSRNKELNKKINQFGSYKLIITDRLHGMIFALLAKTPCLVFENKSYKIKGVYKWIENVNYIQLSNNGNVNEQLSKLLSLENIIYSSEQIRMKYSSLTKLINDKLQKGSMKNGAV